MLVLLDIISALYEKLKLLKFPPGRDATETLKKDLLSTTCRSVNTHELVQKRKRTSKFNTSYVKKYDWLMIGDEGAFCIYCKLFCTANEKPRIAGALTSHPWKLYSRMASLDEHKDHGYHKFAETSAVAFWKVATGKETDVRVMAAGKSEDYKKSKAMLESICTALAVAARQNMPLRGHRNEALQESNLPLTKKEHGEVILSGDVNPGNFISMLKLRHDAGDPKLASLCTQPSTFTSGGIQNELLSTMARQVRTNIVRNIAKQPFTVICDETTDISTCEQLCLAVRYVEGEDVDDLKITERFISFRKMDSVTGKLELGENTPGPGPSDRKDT